MVPRYNKFSEATSMYTETETRLPIENGAPLQQDAQGFMQHTCDIINAGAQAIMISIGHRSRLFDVMAQLPPATSQQIADQAGLAERFVREWLAVMVTARVIDYAPQEQTYYLPRPTRPA
jgi:hypothetical protein